ncbi:cation diffusion facilitator family transporter [Tumebacillus sp. DT12]|uniref:Cation diffusion facilitator family transporter n=1 Tax=Tumebacillus lacus TaxID=2995335 RepID=A0ABT3X1B8_9BACL|nr:cation diffusion facilitator family transporter [Tumebacillus lacus]MCX7569350.1 cation diffusion facilitator family transporter [Tumebacillus lacus]
MALVVTSGIMVAEIVGGIVTNSLALLSDAAHMFSDVAALALSLVALWLTKRPATMQRTFGYYRAEVLAALLNGLTLTLVSLYIFWEALHRFLQPQEVETGWMLVVAGIGLTANLFSAWALMRGGDHHHNLNVRGALLHVIGDALGSVGAILAGVIMMFTGWYYADPIISILIGLLVLISSWRLIKETVTVLLEVAPARVDMARLRRSMLSVPGVKDVHDLHVWMISSGFICMSGHVAVTEGTDHYKTLCTLERLLREEFDLTHTTIQVEAADMHPDSGICTRIAEI